MSGAGLGLWPNPRLLAGLQEAAPSSGVGKLPPGRDLLQTSVCREDPAIPAVRVQPGLWL